jgi:outer membrane protein assembly factor BamE (lipoprotein component of BamABCDE complex)
MRFLTVIFLVLGLAACSTAQSTNGITTGQVQKDIRIGMSGADVARALGNPNIVTTDVNGFEVWTYDRMATTIQQENSASLWSFIVPSTTQTYNSNQKTLTVVIYFDGSKRVRDLAYHSSNF